MNEQYRQNGPVWDIVINDIARDNDNVCRQRKQVIERTKKLPTVHAWQVMSLKGYSNIFFYYFIWKNF